MADTALFRFDAGHGVGLGHLSRCLSLAEALRRQDVGCVLLVPDARIEERAAAAGHVAERQTSDGRGDLVDIAETIELAQKHRCRWVVVDSYRIAASGLQELRNSGFVVIAIDDLAREPLPAHIVVNGGAQAAGLPYRSSSGDTRFLLGTTYALLRPEFWNARERRLGEDVRHVLVTVGGSDAGGATSAILRAIDAHPEPFTITAVVGPFFESQEALVAQARVCRHPVVLADAPVSLVDLMAEADVAVAGGGQTLYELAASGTPTIAVRLAANQAGSMAALVAAGVVLDGGSFDGGAMSPDLASHFGALTIDRGLRGRLSRIAQSVVDGRGAERVASEMRSAV